LKKHKKKIEIEMQYLYLPVTETMKMAKVTVKELKQMIKEAVQEQLATGVGMPAVKSPGLPKAGGRKAPAGKERMGVMTTDDPMLQKMLKNTVRSLTAAMSKDDLSDAERKDLQAQLRKALELIS
jgi:hypothetical protein